MQAGDKGEIPLLKMNMARNNLGIITLVQAVRIEEWRLKRKEPADHAIYDISISEFPSIHEYSEDAPESLAKETENLVSRMKEDDRAVLGLSVSDKGLPLALEMAEKSREAGAPFIAAGGPTFAVEDKVTRKTYTRFFGEGLFDLLCIGHGSPFVQLIKNILTGDNILEKHEGGYIIGGEARLPEGLRVRKAIWGSGRRAGKNSGKNARPYLGRRGGELPDTGILHPYTLNQEYVLRESRNMDVHTMLGTGCGNRCDYCSVRTAEPAYGPEKAAENLHNALRLTTRKRTINTMIIEDPNILRPENIGKLREFHTAMLDMGWKIDKYSIYCSAFDYHGSNRKSIEDTVDELNIRGFLIGRESAYHEGIPFENKLGERIDGKLMTKEMMKERDSRLAEFIGFLKSGRKRKKLNIQGIMTPWETKESAIAKLSDAFWYVESCKGSNVWPSFSFFPLEPDMGAAISRKHEGRYIPVHAIKPGHDINELNRWGYGEGMTGSHFLDYACALSNLSMVRGKNRTLSIDYGATFLMLNLLAAELGFGDHSGGFNPDEVTENIYRNYFRIVSAGCADESTDEDKTVRRWFSFKGLHKSIRDIAHEIGDNGMYDKSAGAKADLLFLMAKNDGGSLIKRFAHMSDMYFDFLRTKEMYLEGAYDGYPEKLPAMEVSGCEGMARPNAMKDSRNPYSGKCPKSD
ncbi:MAG: hypothetical protein R6U32_01055 [Candidatus Woesearchaeota archaeon]